MKNIGRVIGWKFNDQEGMCTEDGVITKFPGGIPSQEDQYTWIGEYDAHLSSIKYKENRKKEYPSVEDQLDMLFHDTEDGTTKWREKIKSIKSKHPKP